MPKYWYDKAACNKLPDDTEDQKHFKELCLRIVAENKPYFMRYVYPDLMAKYNKYIKDTNSKCIREFKMSMSDLMKKSNKTIREKEFIDYYNRLMPVGNNPCTINRISWLFEDVFQSYLAEYDKYYEFDYSILKSGVEYSINDYQRISQIKFEYDDSLRYYQQLANKQRLDKDEVSVNRGIMLQKFKSQCEEICPNEKELCDIVIDMCYSSSKSKQFAWDICGEVIIKNLLQKNNHMIHYPVLVNSDGEFEFGGEQFIICEKKFEEVDELL